MSGELTRGEIASQHPHRSWMTIAFVAGAAAFTFFACDGNKRASTPSAASYVAEVHQYMDDDPRHDLDRSAPCAQIVDAMRQSSADWLSIEAPSNIAALHKELGTRLAVAAEVFAKAGEECRTNSQVLDASVAYRSKFQEWCTVVEASFDVDDCEFRGTSVPTIDAEAG